MLNTFRKGVFALYVFYDVDIIFIAMRTFWTLHSLLILRKRKINVQDTCIIVFGDFSKQCL